MKKICFTIFILLIFIYPLFSDNFDKNIHLYKKIAEYKKVLKKKPNDTEIIRNLAITYGRLGLYKKANECCIKLCVLSPDNSRFRYNLGWTYHRMKKLNKAVVEYKKAISGKDKNESYFYNLSIALNEQKKFKESYEVVLKSLKIFPNSPKLLLVKSDILMGMKKYEESVKYANLALKFYPNYYSAYYNLIVLSIKLNRNGEAINYLKKCIKLDKRTLKYIQEDDDLKKLLECKEVKEMMINK